MARSFVGRAVVVGGGPAGLMAAEVLAAGGTEVTVFEHMPSVGRKLLLAGRGGLNLTHSEPVDAFLTRYGASAPRVAPLLDAFGPDALRAWAAGLGEPTFVGSSGRVFPESFRATPLLRAWLRRLADLGVRFELRQRWVGWGACDEGDVRPLRFSSADGTVTEVAVDAAVFALGGASWPRVGSDGGWVAPFTDAGVAVSALRPANVGVRVAWSDAFAQRFEGVPLKYVGVSVAGGRPVRGDAMVTRTGLEGGPIYAIGAAIRAELDASGRCELTVDLRPDLTAAQLARRLRNRRPKDSVSNWLRRSIGLDPVGVGLVREAAGGELPANPDELAALITAVPVTIEGLMPIDRAISTAGGVEWSELDDTLMLRRLPGTFVAGEMIDWEAPTGGYLLQASFASGAVAGRGALAWLAGTDQAWP
jgi:uncharacterized flavoprotein (TIGR03862 family)